MYIVDILIRDIFEYNVNNHYIKEYSKYCSNILGYSFLL